MHPVASMGKFAAGPQERKGVKYTGTWRIFSGFHLYGEKLHFFRIGQLSPAVALQSVTSL